MLGRWRDGARGDVEADTGSNSDAPVGVSSPVPELDMSEVPWRFHDEVSRAIDASRRWQAVVAHLADGPLRLRLVELGELVTAGVVEVHSTARRIGEVEAVLSTLDPDGATAAYKAARRQASAGDVPVEMEALSARFASVQRLLNLVADTEERLRVAEARLLAAVARAAEVAVVADADALVGVGRDLDAVTSELGALREAMAALG
ncbi:MAG: hypothetical protein IPG97_01880 [Microthrixaceae bacterium]|jgi:hypothetical protein|nr:hypothetical protein [Microthrixaceae bacterium]